MLYTCSWECQRRDSMDVPTRICNAFPLCIGGNQGGISGGKSTVLPPSCLRRTWMLPNHDRFVPMPQITLKMLPGPGGKASFSHASALVQSPAQPQFLWAFLAMPLQVPGTPLSDQSSHKKPACKSEPGLQVPAPAPKVNAVPMVGPYLPGQRHGNADRTVGHRLENGKPSLQKLMCWRCEEAT